MTYGRFGKHSLSGKSGLSMADVAVWLCQILIGILLLQEMVEFGILRPCFVEAEGVYKSEKELEASLGIMDSESLKWGNNRGLNGYDGNRRVKIIKRHFIVDKNGFLIAVMVTVANIYDSKAEQLLMRLLKEVIFVIKLIVTDGGYRGEIAGHVKERFGYLLQAVMRLDNHKSGSNLYTKAG